MSVRRPIEIVADECGLLRNIAVKDVAGGGQGEDASVGVE